MLIKNFTQGRIFAGRLDYQSDLLESINKICIKNNITSGFISIIGAISNLKIGYFLQDEKKYVYSGNIKEDEALEICSCNGNISIKENSPFAHLHIVASEREGKCYGGHLMPGTIVYAAEFYIQETIGPDLIRKIDSETMLPLWEN